MPTLTRVRVLRSRKSSVARKLKRSRQRVRITQENSARHPPSNLEGLLSMAGLARGFPRANARMVTQLAVQLQRNHGNYYTQRVLKETGLLKGATVQPSYAAKSAIMAQRCCAGGCDCSPGLKGNDRENLEVPRRVTERHLVSELQRSQGNGQSLDPGARAKLEASMGVDLRNISIHTDARADRLARSVAAEAFTVGTDIYFRAARYDPRSRAGVQLLAHEITHAVQQSGGAVTGRQVSSGLTVSDPSDGFEREADRSAALTMERMDSAASGGAAAGLPRVQRRSNKNRLPLLARSADSMTLQRKVFTDTSVKGWTVSFNPTAAVTPDAGGQQVTHYDEDADDSKFHQRAFDVAADSTGKIFIAVNMVWQGIGSDGGGGGGGGIIPGLSKEDCKKLPPGVPDEIKKLCEIGGADCKDNVDNASDAVLLALCSALTAAGVIPGLICFAAKLFGADRLLKNFLKKQICGDTPGKKQPPKQTVIASGKGNATLQVSYAVEKDGKMQVFGPGPISSSSGTGAQVVSPVQFTKEATPTGGEVSLAPMIHSVIGQEINDFQQLFDVTVRLPKPQPFSCCQRVFPFVVGTDRFQNEDAAHEQLFTWFQGLHPSIRKSVERGETPIVVAGHASTTGSQKLNLELSQKRANRVKNILQSFFGSDSHPNVFAFGKLLAKQPGEIAEERRADVKIAGETRLEGDAGGLSCGLTNQPGVCDEFPV
jgi:hypothetical protein